MALTLLIGDRRYSSWSLRGYLAAAMSRLPFETKTIWLDRPDSAAELAARTPASRVPVLHDGELVVWDSLAICEYLAELAPDRGLWPAERAARARARSVSAEMHSGFQQLREQMGFDLLARRPGQGHTPGALADVQRIQKTWSEALDRSGGPFLFGALTIADAMYAPICSRFVTYDVQLDATSQRYVDAIFAWPAMQQWCADAEREPDRPS
jgi:glutathione S-transferase